MPVHVLIRFNIEDLSKWRPVFEEAGALRKQFGSLGVRAFSRVGDTHQVMILGRYENLETAQRLFASPEFQAVMKRAGVLPPPDITFWNDVVELPA